jgi:hypothetical protein
MWSVGARVSWLEKGTLHCPPLALETLQVAPSGNRDVDPVVLFVFP